MKITKLRVGKSGVIPRASYSNLKPSYSMEVELEEGDDPNEVILVCQKIVNYHFELDVYRESVNLIQRQFKEIRLYDAPEGLKYPSITSILGYEKDWTISKGELLQHGSMGTIQHEVFWYALKSFLETGEIIWKNPLELPKLQEHVGIVLKGSLKLNWDDYAIKEFGNIYIPKIRKVYGIEQTILNPEIRVGGTYDLIAEIEIEKGKILLVAIDLKTGGFDWRQLAFYGRTWGIQNNKKLDGMMIFPIGKTTNKCGYEKPKLETDIDSYWDEMLVAREDFKNKFNI